MDNIDKEIKIIGARIKLLRQDRNMTPKELAGRLGVSITNMCNIEVGKTAATIQNLLKLIHVLNCEITDFFVDFIGVEPPKAAATKEIPAEDKAKVAEVPESQELLDAIALLRVIRNMDIKGL